MKQVKTHCCGYVRPAMKVVGTAPAKIISASASLNDMDTNPIYEEDF
ncbi:MAG: hypothetical protein IJR34_06245 [Bacteroidales bacterium]|nr:hypothetical protein [Bacteroidales bacterium]